MRKIETLVILVIFLALGLWAAQRCSSKRADLQRRVDDFKAERQDDPDGEERPTRPDTGYVASHTATAPVEHSAPVRPPAGASSGATSNQPAASPSRPAARPTLANPPADPAAAPAATTAKGSTLYVTIDGLNVRKEPGLKGDPIAKLKLHETVTFLNQKTEWTQELSLGTEKVTDHWVRIRTKSGKEGWVFGAGVHYYKMKR